MPRFSGIIPPVVTPLKAIDQLDVDAVGCIADHLIAGGVSGLFVLGTTGEGPSLTYQIRYEMVERTCESVAGRVPVFVGVTDCALAESIHLAEHAFVNGAAGIVAAAPYYFPTDQAAIVAWFTELAAAAPLPLLLYNMPSCVGIHIDIETIVQLANHPNIVGVKDSSGNLDYFRTLCETFSTDSDFVVFMGPEERLSDAVAAGADGGVCGGANLLPRLYVDLYHASKAKDSAEIGRLKTLVDGVFHSIYRDNNGTMNLIPALKFAMELSGLCTRKIAPPLQQITTEHERQIRERLTLVLESAVSP